MSTYTRFNHNQPSSSPMCDVNDVIMDDVTRDNDKLLVKSWNVGGKFALKMSCPDFRDRLKMYHINFFQETHLRPGQDLAVDLPVGYKLIACTRPDKKSFARPWGGVAAVVASTVAFKYRTDLSGPDFLVIQVGNMVYYAHIYCRRLQIGQSTWRMTQRKHWHRHSQEPTLQDSKLSYWAT